MPKIALPACPDERHILRSPLGLIDGFLMADLSRLYLVDREETDLHGFRYFYPKTNNACCLVPANWEGYGQAQYVPPYAEDDPMHDPLILLLCKL